MTDVWVDGPPCCPNAGQMCNCTGACLRPPTVPAGTSAADAAASPAGLTWPAWAVPAIQEVLAEHVCVYDDLAAIYECRDSIDNDWAAHARFGDEAEWREHVAPFIAERIETAWRAKTLRDSVTAAVSDGFVDPYRRHQ